MNVFERAARPFVVFVERFYPDAFVFAILLTLVTFAMTVGLADETPAAAVEIWGLGLTGLLSFIAQIALTLICAHAVAHTGDRATLRASRELQAEGAAYVALAALGLDTARATLPYLKGWAGGDDDALAAELSAIDRVASRLLALVDGASPADDASLTDGASPADR